MRIIFAFLAMGFAMQMGLLAALAGVVPPPPPPQFSGNSETMLSIGIQFDFGDMGPEIVAAARHTKTDSDNDVTGGKVDVTIPILGDKNFVPTVRVLGLMGSRDFQGEAGVGFDFASQQPLLGVGAQAPYSNGGIDVLLNGEVHPFIGVNTYDGAPDRKSFTPSPP